MGITALIAGGLGAVGSIGSALIGSNAAQSASQTQAALGQQALQTQQQMFDRGLQAQQGYFNTAYGALNPYIQRGQNVLPTLQGLLTPGPNQNALLSQTPGFQFASQYGTMAARNALSAQGLGASAGPLATAISQYNNGLASNTWQNVVQALQGYANLGGAAAGSLSSAAGASGNQALASATGAGNAQAGTLQGIGSSLASGTLGSASAISGGLSGASSSLGNAALLYGLDSKYGANGGLYSSGGTAP